MLGEEIQSNPSYKDKTTLLILPELGQDGDINAANGFLNHRSGDVSCRNMWMLAMGAGVPAGEIERPGFHVDLAATGGERLGLKAGGVTGRPVRECLT